MPPPIRIIQMRQRISFPDALVINSCSNNITDWQSDLSPFIIGPCKIYNESFSKNMENAWQYAKVYKCHIDENGEPSNQYFQWANSGWVNPKAIRYPMGKGAKPEYSYWAGKKLSYIEARKAIYGPLYIKAINNRPGLQKLKDIYQKHNGTLVIRDFDGYDHIEKGLSLTEVLNNPKKKMGHAFILAMILLGDRALEGFNL